MRVHGRVAENGAVLRHRCKHLGGDELGLRMPLHWLDVALVPIVAAGADQGTEAREGPSGLVGLVLDVAHLPAHRPFLLPICTSEPISVVVLDTLGVHVDRAPPGVARLVALGALREVGVHALAPVRAPQRWVVQERVVELLNVWRRRVSLLRDGPQDARRRAAGQRAEGAEPARVVAPAPGHHGDGGEHRRQHEREADFRPRAP
mmetsp:Transcript_1806/g.4112  ORF Transcript_1806/g.4112 Transcript_1806/m.4112 type:complete len:205 (-) Transcript_1806:29-643(-)